MSKTTIKKKFKNQQPCGTWTYFNLEGVIIKKESYRKGKLRITNIYNEKGQLIESIDSKGKRKVFEPCNCK